jgi:hypothetical protein
MKLDHIILLSLGGDQYLEIIAPDPAQELSGTMGEELAQITSPFVRTWAAATGDFESVQRAADASGFGSRIIDMSRTRPDGVHLAWRLLFVTGHPFGLTLPFFIDWQGSPHPALDAPQGCQLKSFRITCNSADDYLQFATAIDLDVDIQAGEQALSAVIQCNSGEFAL